MSRKNLPAMPDASDVILRIRGQAIIIDSDLAALYGTTTKRLNEQVKRNSARFPEDFMFRLTKREWQNLRSQNATSRSWGGRRYPPYVFTEHGAVMAANVINSEMAIQMSMAVVRAFVRMRRMALSVEGLARKMQALENKYNKQFKVVFDAIRRLITAPPAKRVDGFSKS